MKKELIEREVKLKAVFAEIRASQEEIAKMLSCIIKHTYIPIQLTILVRLSQKLLLTHNPRPCVGPDAP